MGQFISLFSSIAQSQSDKQAADENAAALRANAAQAMVSAKLKADQIKEQGTRLVSKISANAGGAGFAQSGTILDVMFEQQRQIEREAQLAIYEGQIQSTSNLSQASRIETQAKRQRNIGIVTGIAKFGAQSAGMLGGGGGMGLGG